MPGAFGLLDDRHHARFPADKLVENRPHVCVFKLRREGLLAPSARATLVWGDREYQLATHEGGILIDGNRITLRSHALGMPVFVCGCCQGDAYRLYECNGAWVCRRCGRLDYSSRHRFRSIPGYNQILALRRRLASPRLSRKRKRALVAQVRILEGQLIRSLRKNVNDVLQRRYAREQRQDHASRRRGPLDRRDRGRAWHE